MKKSTALAIALVMALSLSACEGKKADILIPYSEEICCDNEIALQEFTGDVFYDSNDLEKYADFDYY
ncbi:MAG: hypothetical protein K2N72_11455 [Oscillospiraceae bacterium]|nr:hypothetical protein [Oscillospiraceae bacterium]